MENEAGKGFVNQAQTGGIRIEKTSDDGVLKGFTFRVSGTDVTGNAFSKDYVTDENGQIKIDGLRMALDLTEEWDKLDNGSALITGVIVARSDFVEAHPAAVGSFLTAYAASVDWVNANTADAAALIGEYGIVDAAVAEKALPYCNIVCITGAELLEKLPGYLSVLYNADPAAVGGAMPDNSFYFP